MEIPEIPFNRDLTYLGLASYRDRNVLFGIKRKDRRQHVYILGKSGTGKSVLMFNMIIQNIQNGEGVCVVDPHGELVEGVLSAIPEHRKKDVIYFNPADTEYHIGFNVLELIDPKYKHLVASGLMGIFTKIWANAWSARMEYILNNAILALLDTPGTTLLGITRMLVDKDYRQKIISNLKDPVIKAFWVHEYEAWQDKFRNEAIAPIQNKVGQFLSTSIIRNVVGQSVSTINIFDIMNQGKIFLVNVSKGRIGEDNSSLLGGMIITKIQLAAMERVRIPEDERKDFYLYVDEFQNFVTDAFAGILSEARKYRLNLTIAHQYTAQLATKDSSAMRDAVFGNVGTIIVFRVGADDAEFLEKEFEPEFTQQDIVALPNYKVYLKLMIDGITSRPFSAKTLPPLLKGGNKQMEQEVIESSRALYCRPKADVEREINDWSGMLVGEDSGPEKFPAVCSICKKDTLVPFKPEPGRPVYCRDCIAKLKSGELQPIKGAANQIVYDESRFYQPLADLGIEFQARENPAGVPRERRPSLAGAVKKTFTRPPRPDGPAPAREPLRVPTRNVQAPPLKPAEKSKLVFPQNAAKNAEKPRENPALRDILNKTLSENKVFETKKAPTEVGVPTEVGKEAKPEPAPISLSALKDKAGDRKEPADKGGEAQPQTIVSAKDRAASQEDMNRLKDLISSNIETKFNELREDLQPKQPEPPKEPELKKEPEIKKQEEKKPEPQKEAYTPSPDQPLPAGAGVVREVPEDVLRKILE